MAQGRNEMKTLRNAFGKKRARRKAGSCKHGLSLKRAVSVPQPKSRLDDITNHQACMNLFAAKKVRA